MLNVARDGYGAFGWGWPKPDGDVHGRSHVPRDGFCPAGTGTNQAP